MLTKDTIFYAVLNPYFAGYSGYTILTSLTGGWLAGACSIFLANYVNFIPYLVRCFITGVSYSQKS